MDNQVLYSTFALLISDLSCRLQYHLINVKVLNVGLQIFPILEHGEYTYLN